MIAVFRRICRCGTCVLGWVSGYSYKTFFNGVTICVCTCYKKTTENQTHCTTATDGGTYDGGNAIGFSSLPSFYWACHFCACWSFH
jgi:hypothetical protein